MSLETAVWVLCALNVAQIAIVLAGILRQVRGAGQVRLEERDKWVAVVIDARFARDEADRVAEIHEEDADVLAGAVKVAHDRLATDGKEAHGDFCFETEGACAIAEALAEHRQIPARLASTRLEFNERRRIAHSERKP